MADHGYIALHRAVFNHPLFKGEKPFTRFQAWTWLIAQAAWCPTQRRVGRATATLDRGQLATTVRTLANTWGWHRSKVERFLRVLRVDAMIRTRAGETVAETEAETPTRGTLTIITICNYSKFNNSSTGTDSEARQEPRRKPRRGEQQAFEFTDEIRPETSNHSTNQDREVLKDRVKEKRGRTKPRHGQVSNKHGTIWCDHGSDEYKLYADDFHQVTGAWPVPKIYVDGKGRWFKRLGEGHVPLSRATAVAQAAIEQENRQRRRTA